MAELASPESWCTGNGTVGSNPTPSAGAPASGDIGLGLLDLVSLAEAWAKAWENRRAVFEGRRARSAERRWATAPTFFEADRERGCFV